LRFMQFHLKPLSEALHKLLTVFSLSWLPL
jgi:hypothetical protein